LQSNATNPIAPALLELHKELAEVPYTNRVARAAVLRKLATQLGGDVTQDGPGAPAGARAWGVMSGWVQQHGLLVEVNWISFNDVLVGLPAFTEWLCQARCQKLQYEFGGGMHFGDLDEPEDSAQ
jgi:hypothetical protein